jgi:hypothetical protein
MIERNAPNGPPRTANSGGTGANRQQVKTKDDVEAFPLVSVR